MTATGVRVSGAPAIAGVADCANVDTFVLYPHGRVTDVQLRRAAPMEAGGKLAAEFVLNFTTVTAGIVLTSLLKQQQSRMLSE